MDYTLINPQNRDFMEDRSKHIARQNSLRLGCFALTAIFGLPLFLLMVAGGLLLREFIYQQQSAIVSGIFIGSQSADNNQWINYEYRVDDVVYTGADQVSEDWYRAQSDLTALSVFYLRHNPQISSLHPFVVNPGLLWVVGGSGSWLLTWGIIFAGYRVWPRSKIRRLEREGVIIFGTIADVSISQRNKSWNIVYSFVSPENEQKITRVIQVPPNSQMETPQHWQKIAILYVNDELHQPL